MGADAPLAEPQVPDAGARERGEREPRAEAPVVQLRGHGDLGLVAAMPRDQPRIGLPASSSPSISSAPSSTRTRRASACGATASSATASRPSSVACGRTRSTPDGPATIPTGASPL